MKRLSSLRNVPEQDALQLVSYATTSGTNSVGQVCLSKNNFYTNQEQSQTCFAVLRKEELDENAKNHCLGMNNVAQISNSATHRGQLTVKASNILHKENLYRGSFASKC